MSCLRITCHPLGYLCCQGRWASFLYCGWLGVLLCRYLARLFRQDWAFLPPRPSNGRFLAADVQCDLTIPSSVLLALPVSSPCLDTNEETDPQATGTPGCWSLHLCQTNQMWLWEPSELPVAKGCWIAVGAKP